MKTWIFLFLISTLSATEALHLKKIILVDSNAQERVESIDHIALQSDFPFPLGGKVLKEALTNYIEKPLTVNIIQDVENQISDYFLSLGRPFTFVSAREKDVSDGVLVVEIMEACIENIKVVGNCYFKTSTIENWSTLKAGDRIESGQIYSDISWMNRNPYRNVDAIFSPGNAEGSTDIELLVNDRLPLRVYVGVDNTGNDFTGNNRLFAGINWGNVFGTDQILSYQYTADDQFSRLQSHTGYYQIPLPWKNMLTFYGGYSSINAKFDLAGINLDRFLNNGYSGQLSMRYEVPFNTQPSLTHEFTWGVDWKTLNNAIIFNEVSINPHKVNLFQAVAAYSLGYKTDPLRIGLDLEVYGNPGQWLPDQSNSDYSSIRPYAKNVYMYGRGLFEVLWNFSNPLLFFFQLRGQTATTNLLPSEQLGIGGATSVRGYKERQLNADNGLILNVEMQTNPMSVFNYFGYRRKIDQLQVLIFFDYGLANVHKVSLGEKKTENIYSIGPGLRYSINPYLFVRCDYGWQLHHLAQTGPHQRIHFYTSLAY